MALKRDYAKLLQIVFVILLVVCSAQVAWWIGENLHYADTTTARLEALYGDLADSYSGHAGQALPLYLAVNEASGDIGVAPGVIEALHAARDARARRYYWEGGFFLVVLISGMAVVSAAMRHDAALRRRQQNFLAGVSHEFKSPLASIRLAAESLARRGNASDTARWTPRIIADCERLLRTVDNLLDTARLEDGRHRVTAQRVGLGAAIDQAVDEQSARAAGDGIALVQDIDDPALALDVDPEALASILRNLIDNGIKACVAGDGTRVVVSVRSEQGAVTLRVSDDGMGFPPSEAALLFEKFYRVGDERQRRTSGSGLGLYLVLRLTQLSGARVHADSAGPGRGATITVRWPPERRA